MRGGIGYLVASTSSGLGDWPIGGVIQFVVWVGDYGIGKDVSVWNVLGAKG